MIDVKLQKIIADWVHGSNIFIDRNDMKGFLNFSWQSFKMIMPNYEEMEKNYKRIGYKRDDEQAAMRSYETAKKAFDDFVIKLFYAFSVNTEESMNHFVEYIMQTIETYKITL